MDRVSLVRAVDGDVRHLARYDPQDTPRYIEGQPPLQCYITALLHRCSGIKIFNNSDDPFFFLFLKKKKKKRKIKKKKIITRVSERILLPLRRRVTCVFEVVNV